MNSFFKLGGLTRALPATMSVVALAIVGIGQAQIPKLSDFNINWTTPSKDATGSMPIGNGEVVLNTWVEAGTGDIMVLIARTDALSEISRVLKLGQVRIKLTPSPFQGSDFSQQLQLERGKIYFSGEGERLRLFVDSEADVIHVAGTLTEGRKVEVTLENWRTQDRPLPMTEKESAWSVHDAPFPLVESADVIMPSQTGADLAWFHHNATSVVPKLWENQSLTGLPGISDPLLNRTFGGLIIAPGLSRTSNDVLSSSEAIKVIDIAIATHTSSSASEWLPGVQKQFQKSSLRPADRRTTAWWQQFWDRSHVFVNETPTVTTIPKNTHPLRIGVDSAGGNKFPGKITNIKVTTGSTTVTSNFEKIDFSAVGSLQLEATITPDDLRPGRIFDKLTAGRNDGFLFDIHPGNALRFIVGDLELAAPNCLKKGVAHNVKATYDGTTGEAAIFLDGKRLVSRMPESGSLISRGYVLQRYVQACQGRGEYPIKFNGGYFCVEPTPFRTDTNPDYRKWGDSQWFQNVRHMYHPMLATGDNEMMEPFFRLYERVRTLAEARTKLYHGASGAYFPETMTVFGTYSGGDYGWDRTGLQPKEVQCPWWDDAWNQGPELVALMLDHWDYSRDKKFLKERVVPMATSILTYFDTRFKKDAQGRIILDPTQVVETYWEGVINDMPTVAGLIAVTDRLTALPSDTLTDAERKFFARMKNVCPPLPTEMSKAGRQLAPAEKYAPKISNVENGELYAVWPFNLVSVGRPKLLAEAKVAYQNRKNHLDTGWGYDGNVAALLGMTNEAGRILNVKVRNSHPAYRWPATWGPNFDWLPDQNHGGNLLNTTHLMLLQADPLEAGGAIRVLPAWPKDWDVSFKLHAPGDTIVECVYEKGAIKFLKISPATRRVDLVLPD